MQSETELKERHNFFKNIWGQSKTHDSPFRVIKRQFSYARTPGKSNGHLPANNGRLVNNKNQTKTAANEAAVIEFIN